MSDNGNRDTILVESFRAAAGCSEWAGDSYKRLPIYAKRGLHEYVGSMIRAHVPAGAHILDLGAGSGAMSARLCDLGYQVTAADIVDENFRLHGHVPFMKVNMNRAFAEDIAEQFDAVVALEVLEHLENPRHLLRQAANAAAAGGLLFATTPNIENPVSLALLLRSGTFQWFDDEDYVAEGHISPLSQRHIHRALKEVNMTVTDETTFGDPWEEIHWRNVAVLARVLRRLSVLPNKLQGEIYIAVARKEHADVPAS